MKVEQYILCKNDPMESERWHHELLKTSEEIELGYRLVQSAWGKGFATEMAYALLEQAFVKWKVEKVVAATMAENQGSRRVMEKLHMSLEKEFIESGFPGPNQNAVKYSVSREVWLSKYCQVR
jgi:RimJ/RimL family protein N-acetyltransferase